MVFKIVFTEVIAPDKLFLPEYTFSRIRALDLNQEMRLGFQFKCRGLMEGQVWIILLCHLQ